MLHVLKRKRVVVSLGVVASLALTAAAIAYFSSTGSGTGQATVGTSTALVGHVWDDDRHDVPGFRDLQRALHRHQSQLGPSEPERHDATVKDDVAATSPTGARR